MALDFLNNLNDPQKEAVLEIERPVLILAGAGSGKTRVITYKIAYLVYRGYKPDSILGLTFTKKAANEMRERAARLLGQQVQDFNIFLGTFHSFGARVLRKFASAVDLSHNFTIYDEQDQLNLIKTIVKEKNIDNMLQPGLVASLIKKAKLAGISYQEYLNHTAQDRFDEAIYEVYKEYSRRLRSLNAVDFADLLLLTKRLLEQNPSIREHLVNKYSYILVDEYQDTNPLQYSIVYMLSKDRQKISVVGDEDQSIYSWRGATVENIKRFQRDFPQHRLIKLEQNYRSTQIILDAANKVISKNPNRIPKNLWSANKEAIPIKLVAVEDVHKQAQFIVKEISSKFRNNLGNVAVLYRMNHESRLIEEYFLKFGIPYRLVGGVRFYERMEIKDMLAYLKFMANPSDEVSLLRIINVPTRGIGPKAIEKLRELATHSQLSFAEFIYYVSLLSIDKDKKVISKLLGEEVIKRLQDIYDNNAKFKKFWQSFGGMIMLSHSNNVTPSEIIQYVLSSLNYDKWLDKISSDEEERESRRQNIYELVSLTKSKPYKGHTGLVAFLEEIALLEDTSSLEDASDTNKVSLMTIHSAKGLEFETVFIIDALEGVLPHQRSIESPQQLQEERRLFYVAITRAKRYLYIIYPQRFMYMGTFLEADPSRFLNDMPSHAVEYEIV